MLGGQTRENRIEMTQPSGAGSSVIACGTGGWKILIRRLTQQPNEIDYGVGHFRNLCTRPKRLRLRRRGPARSLVTILSRAVRHDRLKALVGTV